MRAPLSIVIPTLNADEAVAGCLGALGEGLRAGLIREVIVSDGGSTDDTLSIAAEAGCEVVSGTAGRGAQLARGASAAKGDWILFLHADTWLDESWDMPVLKHLESHAKKAAVFRLRFRATGFAPWIVARWANIRTRVFNLPYGDQGLLISRALYDEVGGFSDIPLMEDVAIARKLSGRMVMLNGTAATSADRYVTDGWIRRSLHNFVTLIRYFLGANPSHLVKTYTRAID